MGKENLKHMPLQIKQTGRTWIDVHMDRKKCGSETISRGKINGAHSLSARKSKRLHSSEGMQGTNTLP